MLRIFQYLLTSCLFSLNHPGSAQARTQAGAVLDIFFTTAQPQTKGSGQKPCLSSLQVSFDKPVNIATLLGSVLGFRTPTQKRPFYVSQASHDLRTFTLKLASKDSCIQPTSYQSIKIGNGVYNTLGEKLSHDLVVPVRNIPNRQRPSSFIQQDLGEQNFFYPKVQWQKPTLSKKFLQVKAHSLSLAFNRVKTWEQQEKRQSWYRQPLSLLPLGGVILKPFEAKHRSRQFAHPDLLYVLRRAAVFTSALFPDLKTIPVADLSDQKGQTPQVQLGKESILLHPQGSHTMGFDADISYITTGSGNDHGAAYDMEKNFWFLYSVLQSSGVDLVISAYREQLRSLARQAASAGLISQAAVGRFNVILADSGLNHDKHVHISVKNIDNAYQSHRFLPDDDVYTCYLALRPDLRGGNLNFCSLGQY